MTQSQHSNNSEHSDTHKETAQASSMAALAREVEQFVAAAGWDQRPQLFAVVPTTELLRQQPELAEQLDENSAWTPVAQEEALPEGDLAESLGRISWPEMVHGCALAQEIIVLPPDAEAELPDVDDPTDADTVTHLRQTAAEHPRRTEARLVAAVLHDGTAACVMRLRGIHRNTTAAPDGNAGGTAEPDGPDETADELIEHPELAPNLVAALHATLLHE